MTFDGFHKFIPATEPRAGFILAFATKRRYPLATTLAIYGFRM